MYKTREQLDDRHAKLASFDTLTLPTTHLDSLAKERATWDLLVIGAGPSGAFAAREASRQGARVLLVDRARFPRPKVCGCCLNSSGLQILQDAGLGDLPSQLAAPSVVNFQLASRGRIARLPIHAGVALSRERFDVALIQAAVAEGTTFVEKTSAMVYQDRHSENEHPSARRIRLKTASAEQSREITVEAKAVIVAGGLGCRAFENTALETRAVVKHSRIGAGVTLPKDSPEFESGTIFMACHRSGYVGLVRLEDGRLDVAAAFDQRAIKNCGSIGELARQVVSQAGFPVPAGLAEANWQGTPRLTQSRQQVAGHRYFVIGDAAGYVEPFTGEGMTWALASGRAVVPLVMRTIAGQKAEANEWQHARRAVLHNRARSCRILSLLLRYPSLVHGAVRCLAWQPKLAQPFVHSLNQPYRV